ncbi:hypothetical protein [Coxiella endosymbiont of Amblyomma nuttalli]|uniref:hypothetical protein n=1 Tax=Coxiella endosymbiont of Amblyomma nuttalli TaxID=2749996 RepID=UPI001BA77D98|nr:hypothetical protein [Coxiella endosymbiont of Amblyomma nuttalli]QTS83655.1 hypothetical protein CEAn_00106 [Coxiella endosymbiont of Amblyomma nuttalli]
MLITNLKEKHYFIGRREGYCLRASIWVCLVMTTQAKPARFEAATGFPKHGTSFDASCKASYVLVGVTLLFSFY